jgi:hypothetical protein
MVGDFQNDPMWGGGAIRVSFRLMTSIMVVVSTSMQDHIQLLNNDRNHQTHIIFATQPTILIRSSAARLLDCEIKAGYIYPTMDFLERDINLAQS